MSSIFTRLGSCERMRSRIATSAASTVNGAPVSVESKHGRRELEVRLQRPRRRDPRLQNLKTQRLVERADLDAEAGTEARTHPFIDRFEVVRRPVGGDDDVAASVEQRVQRMTEFRLDRFALQELGVVEDQEINRPQALLEGDRGLRLEGGDETVHELLSGQIDDGAALARGGMRNRLQQVGLAEPDGRMDVKRTERRRPT